MELVLKANLSYVHLKSADYLMTYSLTFWFINKFKANRSNSAILIVF